MESLPRAILPVESAGRFSRAFIDALIRARQLERLWAAIHRLGRLRRSRQDELGL